MADQPSARKQIRGWWKERFDDSNEVDVKVLSAQGAQVLRQDAAFCARFLDEFLPAVMYEVGINMLSIRRSDTLRALNHLTAADVVTEIDREPADWSKWLEHDPDSGKHVLLFEMTKEQALAAAREREERIEPDLRRIALLRLAAGRLTAGQKIGDVWTEGELAETERRLVRAKTTGQGIVRFTLKDTDFWRKGTQQKGAAD